MSEELNVTDAEGGWRVVNAEDVSAILSELASLRRERDESRRMLDDARAQEPVAYLHNKRVDVIHTSVKSLLSDFAVNSGPESMLRPIDKQEHYTIPLYASPVPPAAVPAVDVAALAKAVRDIPSRLESLGGQRFAYVKLSEVIDTIYSVIGKQTAVPDDVAKDECCNKPVIGRHGYYECCNGVNRSAVEPTTSILAASQREGGGT